MEEMDKITEYSLEIRYKADPKFLDYRGQWVDIMSEKLALPKWKIAENVSEISNMDKSERVYSSHQNFGYLLQNTPTDNYFSDKAKKFLNEHLKLNFFNHESYNIERIGARSRIAKKFNGKFDELEKKYLKNYVNITQKAKSNFGNVDDIDIGIIINFKDSIGRFSTNTGPMYSDQIKQTFKWLNENDAIFDVGYFVDIDYWMDYSEPLKKEVIISTVSKFCNALNDRNKQFDMIISN